MASARYRGRAKARRENVSLSQRKGTAAMTIDLLTLILVCLVVVGIAWAYPRIPPPGNLILVIIVAIICVAFLLKIAGIIVLR